MSNQLCVSPIQELFNDARSAGVEYVYTLLRVEYYSIKFLDPLLRLRAELGKSNGKPDQEGNLRLYTSLIECLWGRPGDR